MSDTTPDQDELRRRARERMAASGCRVEEMADEDVRKLAQELQVHQVELELQNEELREAREAFAAARDRYADLFERAPVAYLTLDTRGCIGEANAAAADLLGVERREGEGAMLTDFVAPESQDDWHHHRRALPRLQGSRVDELVLRPARGDPRVVRIETTRVPDTAIGADGAPCRAALVDITERRRAEAALQASHDQLEKRVAERTRGLEAARAELENLLASLGNGLFGIDDRGRFNFINPAALELLGFESQEDVLGRETHPLIHDPDTDADACPVCGTSSGPLERLRDRFRRADGTVFPVEVYASPVRTGGESPGRVVAFTDVSPRLAALEQLSNREREVLGLLVEGQTNKGVARALDLSTRTVEEHRGNIMAKLGASSFAELVRLAQDA